MGRNESAGDMITDYWRVPKNRMNLDEFLGLLHPICSVEWLITRSEADLLLNPYLVSSDREGDITLVGAFLKDYRELPILIYYPEFPKQIKRVNKVKTIFDNSEVDYVYVASVGEGVRLDKLEDICSSHKSKQDEGETDSQGFYTVPKTNMTPTEFLNKLGNYNVEPERESVYHIEPDIISIGYVPGIVEKFYGRKIVGKMGRYYQLLGVRETPKLHFNSDDPQQCELALDLKKLLDENQVDY